MLSRIGFRYAERIDPFDGGPHFVAAPDEISLVQDTFVAKLRGIQPIPANQPRALVGRDLPGPPYFRAVCTNIEHDGKTLLLDPDSAKALEVDTGSELFVLPLP
jgi:arginine N-succinyltransferase